MDNTLVEDSAVQIPTRMVFDKKRYMRVLLLETAVAREYFLLEGDVTPKCFPSKVLSLESDVTPKRSLSKVLSIESDVIR